MSRRLACTSLLVPEYEPALAFFTQVLRWQVLQDERLSDSQRWLVVAPGGAGDAGGALLLARAATPEQVALIGRQGGGRVWLFLHSTDFWGDYHHMRSQGVVFCEKPREEVYGTVVVFADLYGNQWDLIQRR